MGVGFSWTDQLLDMAPWSKDVMGKSKMGFVMQMVKKVFSVENGFGMVVTKKGFEVGSKRVLHFEGVSDRSILGKI
jgi:hypothetical protein